MDKCIAELKQEISTLRDLLVRKDDEIRGLRAEIDSIVRRGAGPILGLIHASYDESFGVFNVEVRGKCTFVEGDLIGILDSKYGTASLSRVMGDACLSALLAAVTKEMGGMSFAQYKQRRGGG